MENVAKLITALASLLWPVLIAILLFHVRKELKEALALLPRVFGRLKSAKFAGIELELDKLAASEEAGSQKGEITANQISIASKLEVEAKDAGIEPFLKELDRLCLEYDRVRRVMASGPLRTREQTRILVQMRGLAPATSSRISTYESSGSAGSRLAAVAMMQMEPTLGDIDWLLERFRNDVPFIFYHAALALANIANIPDRSAAAELAAREAKKIIASFPGEPDKDSIMVLDSILNAA